MTPGDRERLDAKLLRVALGTRVDVEIPVLVRHCARGHVAVRVYDTVDGRVAAATVDKNDAYGHREALAVARAAEGTAHVAPLVVLRWWLVDDDWPTAVIEATCPRGHVVSVLCATIRHKDSAPS